MHCSLLLHPPSKDVGSLLGQGVDGSLDVGADGDGDDGGVGDHEAGHAVDGEVGVDDRAHGGRAGGVPGDASSEGETVVDRGVIGVERERLGRQAWRHGFASNVEAGKVGGKHESGHLSDAMAVDVAVDLCREEVEVDLGGGGESSERS